MQISKALIRIRLLVSFASISLHKMCRVSNQGGGQLWAIAIAIDRKTTDNAIRKTLPLVRVSGDRFDRRISKIMAKSRETNVPSDGGRSNSPKPISPERAISKNIFALANRGMLLDIVVFLANVFLMRSLTKRFVDLYHQVSEGDRTAEMIMFAFCVSIFVCRRQGRSSNDGRFTNGCKPRAGR